MTSSTVFMFASALSAVFGIVYLPVLMKQPKAFVSPYVKADVRRRAFAGIADALLVASCLVLYMTQDSILFIAVGAFYLLFRDALFIPGQSIGKFLFGVRVISLANGCPCSRLHSVQRNFILLVPGLNIVAVALESVAIARDPQGQRLGDTLANTQVVEGLSVKELATSLQQALLEVPIGRQRDKQPVEVKMIGMRYLFVFAALLFAAPVAMMAVEPESVEFIFESAPFASAHASTIVETRSGLVAAWFGGTREGADDVGIWLSRRVSGKWTPPVEVATGVQSDGRRFPTWNPVLFELRAGELALFYKVGPSPRAWWGMVRASSDDGRTWSDGRRLPDGTLGPIKNKPVRLQDGSIIAPSSTESPESPSAWRVHFERTRDAGKTWSVSRPPSAPAGSEIDAIQPSILTHGAGKLQAIGRTRSGRVFETWSDDSGQTWSPVTLLDLPNPSAGTDALTLKDGRHLLVYNHTPKGRTPLNVAVSRDGRAWTALHVLENEPGEYSYPAVIQTADGLVHITYTWRRERIKHVVLDPAKFKN